jgi:hypothetical protein
MDSVDLDAAGRSDEARRVIHSRKAPAVGVAVLAVLAGLAAGCLPPPRAPVALAPSDCFGDVPYAFAGWTTLADLGQTGDPQDRRVFALTTRDEVVLDVSRPAADGSTVTLVGRGVCWTRPDAPGVARGSLGEVRRISGP